MSTFFSLCKIFGDYYYYYYFDKIVLFSLNILVISRGSVRFTEVNFTCRSCNASYIGKTFRHVKVRVLEHQEASSQTNKHLKGTLSTSMRDHMLDWNHIVSWDGFKVLGRESNHWLLEIKESLFIKRDRPSLNKNIYSHKLFLF